MKVGSVIRILWPVALLVAITLSICNLWFGALNQDEGWYLYAGRMVAEGGMPFIDFASTQGPVMSFVYAVAWPLVKSWGVVGGRLFTAILGLACALASALLARRLVGDSNRDGALHAGAAALLCFMLIGFNVYQSYFFVIVKTYALSGLFIILGFLALTYVGGRRGLLAATLCGASLVLAAAVRISAAVTLPIALLSIIIRRKPTWFRYAAVFLGGCAVVACVVFIPFVLRAPEALWFGLVEYHAGRATGGAVKALAYKAGFVSRLTHAYFVPVAALLVLLVRNVFAGRSGDSQSTMRNTIFISVAAVSLVHFMAPFPYDDYQVMIFPLFAAALSALLAEVCSAPRNSDAGADINCTERSGAGPAARQPVTMVLILMFVLNGAAALSSPMIQEWFVGRRDRIWWPMRTQTPLQVLRETGALVRSVGGSDGLLLTQDTYLAVESGLRVPEGLELGPFSYFPEWTDARAEACHVLNRAGLQRLLCTSPASVAAFSEYGLAIAAPAVVELCEEEQEALWSIVRSRFDPWREIAGFGQGETRLRVLVKSLAER